MPQAVDKMDVKHKVVSKFLQNVIVIAGLSIACYSLYKTVVNFETVLTFQNLVSFLLPSTITILFIPFFYFLALYAAYQVFFVTINQMTENKEKIKLVKCQTVLISTITLEKLVRIKSKFNIQVFYEDTDFKSYIHNISKQSKI